MIRPRTASATYRPWKHQKLFHEALNDHRFVMLLGGRQSGKGLAGAHQAWIEISRDKPPRRGLIVAPTYQMAEIPARDFASILPGAITGHHTETSGRQVFETVSGYTVEVKSADDPERLRGDRANWIWIDEGGAMPNGNQVLDILLPCLLASRGKLWITTTPKGRNWLYTGFYLNSLPSHPSYDREFSTVRATTWDNFSLDKGDVQRLKRKYSKQFGAQEIEAEFVGFEGQVYKEFDPEIHICESLHPESKDIQSVFAGLDFGFNDAMAYIWIAAINGRYVVVDEYYQRGKTSDVVVASIRDNPWERLVRVRYCDPRAPQERADFARYGLPCVPSLKADPSRRINEISRLLESRQKETGKPALQVCDNCLNTIREFETYHYKEGSDNRSAGEIPVGIDDHAMDALGYGMLGIVGAEFHGFLPEPTPEPPPGTWGYIKRRRIAEVLADRELLGLFSNRERDSENYW